MWHLCGQATTQHTTRCTAARPGAALAPHQRQRQRQQPMLKSADNGPARTCTTVLRPAPMAVRSVVAPPIGVSRPPAPRASMAVAVASLACEQGRVSRKQAEEWCCKLAGTSTPAAYRCAAPHCRLCNRQPHFHPHNQQPCVSSCTIRRLYPSNQPHACARIPAVLPARPPPASPPRRPAGSRGRA